jgi:hypothetical protein
MCMDLYSFVKMKLTWLKRTIKDMLAASTTKRIIRTVATGDLFDQCGINGPYTTCDLEGDYRAGTPGVLINVVVKDDHPNDAKLNPKSLAEILSCNLPLLLRA